MPTELMFSHAKLRLTKEGFCRGVEIDGHLIPNCRTAKVVTFPGDITKVELTVFVSSVESVVVEEDAPAA